MNDQNGVMVECDAPVYLDTTDLEFISWLRSLTPEDKQVFVDMLQDAGEMIDEGYEAPEIRQYLRRNYGK